MGSKPFCRLYACCIWARPGKNTTEHKTYGGAGRSSLRLLGQLDHLPQPCGVCSGFRFRLHHLGKVPAVLLHQRRDIFCFSSLIRFLLLFAFLSTSRPRRLRASRRRSFTSCATSSEKAPRPHARPYSRRRSGPCARVRAPAPARVPVLDLGLVDLHLLEQAFLLLLLRAAGRAGAALLDADHFSFVAMCCCCCLSAVLLVGWRPAMVLYCCSSCAAPVQHCS